MFQFLILIGVLVLLYFLTRFFPSPNKEVSSKSLQMVKCKKCGVNIPESEAFNYQDDWYCSEEHTN